MRVLPGKRRCRFPRRAVDRPQDRGVDAASHIVLDAIAVLLRRESGCRPLAGIDTQPRTLDVLVIDDPLAVAGRDVVAARVVRNFDDFPEELVRLLLARARVLVAPTAPLSRHYPMMHGTPARVLAQHLGRNLRFK